MSGLIDVGTSYKDKALSGFVRQAAEQQKIDRANKEIESQEKQNNISMVASAGGAVASLIATLLVA